MNRKPSFDAVAKIFQDLTEEEQLVLIDNSGELKKFAGDLAIKIAQNTFFISLSDHEVPEKFQGGVVKWRKLAAELGYSGPVAWKVREGFTLKSHAPKAGPCRKNFEYLQDWSLKNDEATKNTLIFFIPRLVEGSKRKTVVEQIKILSELRMKFKLPAHHLTSFGDASVLAGLIFANFKRTGERVPLNKEVTRTDTLDSEGYRLGLGGFGGGGLVCAHWIWDDDGRVSDLGCFPLGVELGD